MVRIRFDAGSLRRRRELSGLAQGELAALLGMREGTYRSYESAACQPKEGAVAAMACLFGIELCAKRVLELLGVGALKAPSREDVDVVHDYMGVRDMPDVVDDGHLVLAEVLARPGNGEFACLLAEALQLAPNRGKLLQDIGGVHGLAPEVVGDAVQGVGCLVLLVAPLVELAVEAVRAGEIEHYVALCRDVLRWQLQEKPHQRGGGDVQRACERLCAFNVRLANARVLPSLGIRVGQRAIEAAARWARLPVPTSAISCVVRTRYAACLWGILCC